MAQKFTHLHCHSEYSLLDGLPKIDELLNYVKKSGMDSVALTDHGNISGAVEFYKKATKMGIKPILGCEMYLAYEQISQKRPNIDDKRYHLVLLVKNEIGYKNLVKLITKAHLEGFYYKPRIDEELLARYSEGLIGLSACLQGKISKLILAKKIDEAEKTALKYQEIFGKENFYLELQHHPNLAEQKKVNKVLISISKKLKIPLVATNDCHYLKSGDAEAQDVLMLINTGADPNDPERLTMKADDFSLRPIKKMVEDFKDLPEAIENTQKIAELCNFKLDLRKINLPKFETPNGKSSDDYLKELCFEGLEKRYGWKPKRKSAPIIDRLNYELETIKKTGFASYFLIVQDFVNWAKENRIVVGPGRGSVGGSLVAYLLNITNIDPLKYGLLFERFLNPERISMPDIDLDFTDRRRDEVINYVSQKYGRDKVAQIITFGRMAARAVVRDVGRAFGYPYSYCDKIAKLIPAGFTLDETLAKINELREIYLGDPKAQKLIDFAKKLEGVARHVSTHACGVVISAERLDNIVPLQHPTQDEQIIVTQYEMYSIEDLGLLKMDFLGLKNLTIIEDTLAKIYAIYGKKVDIENIPLNDRATYKLLQKGDTVGVFQLESGGMQRYLKQLKPTQIEDVIALLALYRPGPMQFIPDYIAGKFKRKKIEYLHPKLKPILEKTFGICVYQEQLMQITRQLAGFSLSEADVLRKAVGKKIRTLLESQQEKLINGMIKNGIKRETAERIWNWVLPFARYGFNKSHSAAYALIAYQTAYLKSHFPLEFLSSLLTSERHDVERIGFLISECKKMGIEVLSPDINESFLGFSIVPKTKKIRFGLVAIKNIGESFAEAIVRERKERGNFNSIFDFLNRIGTKYLNKKPLESMIKSGVFDRFGERNQFLENLEKLLQGAREQKRMKLNGQKGLFDRIIKKEKIGFTLDPVKPALKSEKLKWEKELLGLYVSSHPLEGMKNILEKNAIKISKINSLLSNKRVRIGGIISSIKKILTRNGQPMIFMNLEGLDGKIEVVVFPGVLMKNNVNLFQENKIVFVSGKINMKDNVPKIIADSIEEILEG
ncbi:DNA polymerase III subunit alpha [Parcubacteria bacterium DG_74_2]|nr:MAG: DNA polymerase III subunit alpha [Parcubacteria bacterium DG_74_2]